jgi:Predicted S-adenosylmethionine-dependent methyltransferase involved in cell envelope biogenesis
MMDHNPVLLQEVLNILSENEGLHLYVDATLGAGGHAFRVLQAHPEAHLIGFDQDASARSIATRVLSPYRDRVEIIAGNFETMGDLSLRNDWTGADAMLFDLGVSNMQLVTADRGFSFQEDGPLDMRMNQNTETDKQTAAELLAESDIRTLTTIFREYGEERFAYQIARGIVRHREHGGSVNTTLELAT